MNNDRVNVANKAKEAVQNLIVLLFLFGGIGGAIITYYTGNSLIKSLSFISFLPIFNMWFWQWLEYRKISSQIFFLFKLLSVSLSITLSLFALMFPDQTVNLLIFGLIGIYGLFILIFLIISIFQEMNIAEVIGMFLLIALASLAFIWPDTFLSSFILIVFIGIFIIYLFISTILCIYFRLIGRDLDVKPLFGVKYFNNYFFFSGCLIGLMIFFAAGFERILFFLPISWGYIDEEEIFISYRQHISLVLGLISSIGFMFLLEKASKKEKEY